MRLFSAFLLAGTLVAVALLVLTVKAESCQDRITAEVSDLVERRGVILGDDWVDSPEGFEVIDIGARLEDLQAEAAHCFGGDR